MKLFIIRLILFFRLDNLAFKLFGVKRFKIDELSVTDIVANTIRKHHDETMGQINKSNALYRKYSKMAGGNGNH